MALGSPERFLSNEADCRALRGELTLLNTKLMQMETEKEALRREKDREIENERLIHKKQMIDLENRHKEEIQKL